MEVSKIKKKERENAWGRVDMYSMCVCATSNCHKVSDLSVGSLMQV